MISKKTGLFILVLSIFSLNSIAQAPYQKLPRLPIFRILGMDSTTWISQETVKKGRPVMIVLFSPDCDHCIKQTEDFKKNMDKLAGVEIVMTSYQPVYKMREFQKKFKLEQYSNFYFGRDVQYFFGPYYQLKSTPFIAVYDSAQQLKTAFDGGASVEKLLAVIRGK